MRSCDIWCHCPRPVYIHSSSTCSTDHLWKIANFIWKLFYRPFYYAIICICLFWVPVFPPHRCWISLDIRSTILVMNTSSTTHSFLVFRVSPQFLIVYLMPSLRWWWDMVFILLSNNFLIIRNTEFQQRSSHPYQIAPFTLVYCRSWKKVISPRQSVTLSWEYNFTLLQ